MSKSRFPAAKFHDTRHNFQHGKWTWHPAVIPLGFPKIKIGGLKRQRTPITPWQRSFHSDSFTTSVEDLAVMLCHVWTNTDIYHLHLGTLGETLQNLPWKTPWKLRWRWWRCPPGRRYCWGPILLSRSPALTARHPVDVRCSGFHGEKTCRHKSITKTESNMFNSSWIKPETYRIYMDIHYLR